MRKQVVILHGTKGSPEGNWFLWLKKKLEERGVKCFVPRLPTPDGQTKENWCAALREQAPIFGLDTVLVGHSCGATFMLHILEVVQEPVMKSIFVSGFIDKLGMQEYDELNSTFVEHEFDWEKIKANAGKIKVLYGDGDPYVPYDAAVRLAKNLGVELTVVKNGGHLNSEAGYSEFEELLRLV